MICCCVMLAVSPADPGRAGGVPAGVAEGTLRLAGCRLRGPLHPDAVADPASDQSSSLSAGSSTLAVHNSCLVKPLTKRRCSYATDWQGTVVNFVKGDAGMWLQSRGRHGNSGHTHLRLIRVTSCLSGEQGQTRSADDEDPPCTANLRLQSDFISSLHYAGLCITLNGCSCYLQSIRIALMSRDRSPRPLRCLKVVPNSCMFSGGPFWSASGGTGPCSASLLPWLPVDCATSRTSVRVTSVS